MSHGLLDFPGRQHADLWLVILIAATAAAAVMATLWEWQLSHAWRHHPFRMTVEGHLANAAIAVAVLLGVASAAHGLGWDAWGAPLLGVIGILLLLATVIVRRVAFLPQMHDYEAGSPELTTPRAKLPRAQPDRMMFPVIVALGGAPAAYLAFGWHSWNHAFHMGMSILGFLVVFAVASLVASQLEDVARFQRDIGRRPRARGRR